MSEGNKPKNKFRVGNVTVTVWENEVKVKDNTFKKLSVSPQKSYKDGEEWKNVNSYSVSEIPKLILALQKAYEDSFTPTSESRGEE